MSATTSAALTEGAATTHLARMAIPMVWALLAMMGFNFADTWFVARLGPLPLAAMSFTFPVVMVVVGSGIGLMAGTSSVIARAIGEGDTDRVRRLATDALVLSLLVSALLTAVGWSTVDPLFRLLGANESTLPLVRDYMLIWYGGIVFVLVPMAGMAIIRATGDSRMQSRIMIAAAGLNLVLDPILIFGMLGAPRLELQGAAVATVLARAASMVACYYVLRYRLRLLIFTLPSAAMLWSSWRRVLHVTLPAAGTNTIIPVSTGIIVAMLAQFGTGAVAGYGVAIRVEALTLVGFFALSAVIGPFVGQNLGAGKVPRIAHAMVVCARFCLVVGLLIAAALAALGPFAIGLFSDDPGVVTVGSAYLRWVPVSFGAAGIVMVVNAAFNGMGRPLPAAGVSLIRTIIIYVPFAWVGAMLFGVDGIFAAACGSNLVSGWIAYRWFRRSLGRIELVSARLP